MTAREVVAQVLIDSAGKADYAVDTADAVLAALREHWTSDVPHVYELTPTEVRAVIAALFEENQ